MSGVPKRRAVSMEGRISTEPFAKQMANDLLVNWAGNKRTAPSQKSSQKGRQNSEDSLALLCRLRLLDTFNFQVVPQLDGFSQ